MGNSLKAATHVDQGVTCYRKKDYDQAILHLKLAAKYSHRDTMAFYNLGLVYYAKSCFDDAIQQFSHVLQINPKHAEAYINRSLCHFEQGNHAMSISDASHAIKCSLRNEIAHFNRGVAYYSTGNFRRASHDFNAVLVRNKTELRAVKYRALTSQALHHYSRALRDWTSLEKARKTLSDTELSHVAVIYALVHDFAKAIELYSQLITSTPQDAAIWNRRATCRMLTGDYTQAIDDLDNAIRLNTDSSYYLLNRSKAFMKLHQYKKAGQDLAKGIRFAAEQAKMGDIFMEFGH